MLTVRSHDPYIRRKGRVPAVIILGLAASGVVLSIVDLLRGQYEYCTTNSLFLALVLAMSLVRDVSGRPGRASGEGLPETPGP